MPIYEYRCSSCGHQQEFLQKVSDPPHTVCTACGRETFSKMLTAAGFQLKGSGWYVTDFRNPGGASKAGPGKSESKAEAGGEAKGESKAESKPAAAADAAPKAKTEAAPKPKPEAKAGS